MNRSQLNQIIQKEGLIPLGVVPLFYSESFERFLRWRNEGKHAGLKYLEKYDELRKEPERLLPGAKCAIIVALRYGQSESWPLRDEETPRVAQYAKFNDYHQLLKRMGERIVTRLKTESIFKTHSFRVLVDTAPVLERALAAQTRESFIGKNTCLIHPSEGSFLLLGEILTTFTFQTDQEEKKVECGTCSLCQVECPTGALNEDYILDSNRCLAYWTIENRGPIPEEFWPHLSKYYFGCDICQIVCPFNEEAKTHFVASKVVPREMPSLYEVATMNQQDYERYFGGTPMTRAKRNGLRRNALIAMCVTRHPKLNEALQYAKKDGGFPIEETSAQIKKYSEQSFV